MASFMKEIIIKHRTPRDDMRDELSKRLVAVGTKLAEINAAKRIAALAAAAGDEAARLQFLELEAQAAAQRTEIDLLTSAIEAIDQQKAVEERRAQQERAARGAAERKRIIDIREREARENILRTIEQLERSGDHAQARIWKRELETLRHRLETGQA